jgi:hypothetical protein
MMGLLFILVFDTNCNLTVSISQQTSVIDVSGSYNHLFVIHNHQFTMNINDLSDWDLIENVSFSETKEVNVIGDLFFFDTPFNKHLEKTVFAS